MEHLIELKQVYKIYQMGEDTVHALDGVDLTIDKGEFVAIVGSSGSGKSTAMNIIGCLDVPTAGTYHLGGVDVSTMDDDQQAEIRNKMLGFIFQQYNLIPKLNVLENVELPLLYAGVPAGERRERAVRALERVGLAAKQKNLPSQLSGGQQQRVSIARALAGNPSVILADEPTGALDSHTGREVLGFLKKLNREGDTVVLITHDNSIAVKADRIVRLQDGRILYDGDAHDPRAVVQPGSDEETRGGGGMNYGQSFRLALKSLAASKMRSLLTMLGIIIGVASVIIILALGNGVQGMIDEQVEKLGINMIQTMIYGRGDGSTTDLDPDDMYDLVEEHPDAAHRRVPLRVLSGHPAPRGRQIRGHPALRGQRGHVQQRHPVHHRRGAEAVPGALSVLSGRGPAAARVRHRGLLWPRRPSGATSRPWGRPCPSTGPPTRWWGCWSG